MEGARKKADSGKLLAGTIDTWLIWNLTGGRTHATDYTNANSTLLFNINSLEWDDEILKVFGIPANILPELQPPDAVFGRIKKDDFFTSEIPVSGVLGDAHGAQGRGPRLGGAHPTVPAVGGGLPAAARARAGERGGDGPPRAPGRGVTLRRRARSPRH